MADLLFEYLPVPDAYGKAPQPVEGDDVATLIYGAPDFGPLVNPSILDAVAEAGEQPSPLLLQPVGMAGAHLWNEIPWELARLIGGPDRDSLFIVPRPQALAALQEYENLWHWISSLSAEEVTVLPAMNVSLFDSRLPVLTPETPRVPDWLGGALKAWISNQSGSAEQRTATLAGLHQLHDDLDGSHELAQSIEGVGQPRNGDYWHAIMHRREGDYGNAKYWFRNVGRHPLFESLADGAAEILHACTDSSASDWATELGEGGWNAAGFVDLCHSLQGREDSPLEVAARRIQWLEMLLLMQSSQSGG